MIKKYKEFLESEEFDKLRPGSISLSLSDLNADYEFHKNVYPFIEKSELLWDEYCEHKLVLDNAKYADSITNLRCEVVKYIKKIFAINNLKCSNYCFDVSDENDNLYGMYFVGDKSDLKKINKYYGITGDVDYVNYPLINGEWAYQ